MRTLRIAGAHRQPDRGCRRRSARAGCPCVREADRCLGGLSGPLPATRSAIAMPSSGATEPQRQTHSRCSGPSPGWRARRGSTRAWRMRCRGHSASRWPARSAGPTLAVRITQDSEGVAETRSSESIDQYTVEFSGLFHLRGRAFGAGGSAVCDRRRRLSPAAARGSLSPRDGASGIRGRRRALLAAWAVGQATARWASAAKRALVVRSRGIDFEDKNRAYPRLSALGFIAF